MPFALEVTPGEPIARVRAWGRDDFESTLDAMRRIGGDARLVPGMPVLMDVRELDYLATPPEVAAFAESGAMPALFSGHRVAILVRRGTQFGVARAFASRVEGSGAEIEVFVEPELALAWLGVAR